MIERNYKVMALKKLSKFLYFDDEGFFEGKRFVTVSKQPWIDFKTKELQGSKIEVVITTDKTDYGCETGEIVSNIYEKLVFKVAKEIDIPLNVEVKPVNPICTVYGEFRNQLAVVCDDIQIVSK